MTSRYLSESQLMDLIDNTDEPEDDRDPDYNPKQCEDDGDSSEDDEINQTVCVDNGTDDGRGQTETHVSGAEDGQNKRQSRKRICDPSNWKKNIRKRRRNTGEEYTSLSNKTIPRKNLKHVLCGCVKKCADNISGHRRLQIHESFWKIGDWSIQNAYLVGLVKASAVKKHDRRDRRDRNPLHMVGPALPRPKEVTRNYFLKDPAGNDVQVCKVFFLQAFSVSNGRLSRALSSVFEAGSPVPDKRGRHEPGHKTETERIDHLKKFIQEIPQHESHYTRARHVNRKYLAPGLTKARLFNLYKAQCTLDSVQPVANWKFRNTFDTDFPDISFHQPLKDTCKTCDILAVQIKEAKDTGNTVKQTEKEHVKELHLRRAEDFYGFKD